MIDISTHKIVDMINSRDHVDVVEWLKTFPNIKTVSRDGSISYRNAIKEAHPDAIQVSDRFHLLKNLTEYCKDYIMKTLNQKVSVPLPSIPIKNAKFSSLFLSNILTYFFVLSVMFSCIIIYYIVFMTF